MYSMEFEKRFESHFRTELPIPLKPQKTQKKEKLKVSENPNIKESILSSSYNAFKNWSSDLAKSKLPFTSTGFSLSSALNKITKPKSRLNVEYLVDCKTPTFKPPVRRSTSSLNLYDDDFMYYIVGSFRKGSENVAKIKSLGSLNDISYHSENTEEIENEIPKYENPPNIDMDAPIGERPSPIGAESSLEADQIKINCSETLLVPEKYGRLSLDSQNERIYLSSSIKESLDLSYGPPVPPPRSKKSFPTKLKSTSDLKSCFTEGQDISKEDVPSKAEQVSSEPVKPARSKKANNTIAANKPKNECETENKDFDEDENRKQNFDALRIKLSNRIQLKPKLELDENLDLKAYVNLKNNNNETLEDERDGHDQAISASDEIGFSNSKGNNSKAKTEIPKPPPLPSMTKPTKTAIGVNSKIQYKCQNNTYENAACKIESSQINQSPKRPQRKKVTKNAPKIKDSMINNKVIDDKRIPIISDLIKSKINLISVECPKPPIRKSSIENRNAISRPKTHSPTLPYQKEVKI